MLLWSAMAFSIVDCNLNRKIRFSSRLLLDTTGGQQSSGNNRSIYFRWFCTKLTKLWVKMDKFDNYCNEKYLNYMLKTVPAHNGKGCIIYSGCKPRKDIQCIFRFHLVGRNDIVCYIDIFIYFITKLMTCNRYKTEKCHIYVVFGRVLTSNT